MTAIVTAVSRAARHRFSKQSCDAIRLVAGIGVEGDAHAGEAMRHRSRWAKTRTAPNTRQVHLIHAELLEELAMLGFAVAPGQLGENVTTRGIDLLALSAGTRLGLGAAAVIELTGLRNPCRQMEKFATGLMAAVLDRTADGALVRKAGVLAIVVAGGEVGPGDEITVLEVPESHRPLAVV